MQGPNTATVETLTAEVRVLKMGTRQVTKAVARQLDRISDSHLEPFGRLGFDPKGIGMRNWLIGRSKIDGTLCVAFYFDPVSAWEKEDVEQYAAYQALPLIVLAG